MATAEEIKRSSNYLRGTIREQLAIADSPFGNEDEIVLKFHGIYQQDDRDVRRERTQAKLPLDLIYMIRVGIPGGVLTPEQYLVMDKLADEVGNGTLRFTTRQAIQYHFVRKTGLRPLLKTLNENLVTSIAACGDVVRNVMCCPAPYSDALHAELNELTQSLAKRLRPKTSAYYEVWVDGEKAATASPASPASPEQIEPLYRDVYLPRKFKVSVAFPGDNCIDVYAQDVAAVALTDGERITGFTLLVGGGFGTSHSDDTTYPRIGTPLATVSPDEVSEVIEAIVAVQRDNGNREDRKHARLKYLIDRWGMERFKEEVERELGRSLTNAQPLEWEAAYDHLGWHEQGDGKWFLGVRVEAGRVLDKEGLQLRSALREIVERYRPLVRLTPNQDVLFGDIDAADRTQIEAILRKAAVAFVSDLAPVVRTAMACPALPTCGLALTESERVLPELLGGLQTALGELGLADEPLTFRMTGCPNGCARPYNAEIGLVGRTKTSYDIMLGGNALGSRLAQLYAKGVKRDQIIPSLRLMLERFRDERDQGEAFGDWCVRVGVDKLAAAN